MPTLTELHEQRGQLVTAARERLDQINANTDESRAAELESQHDAAMADLDALDARIEREERTARAEREQDERRERQQRELRDRRPIGPVDGDRQEAGDAAEYRQAFHAYVRAQGQLGALSEEQRSILQRGYQAIENSENRAQTTTSNAAGGYTVPVELQAEIIKSMKAWGPMYDPGITREWITATGASMPFPTVDDTNNNTTAATTQGQTLPDDGSGDVTFGQKALGAFAYATPWVRVSKEFVDDSILAVESLLGDLLGERCGRLANKKLTNGAGGGADPTGIVTGSSLGVMAASATAILADELLDLEHSVDPAYRVGPKVGWMMHDQTLKFVRKIKDGQGRYVWQMGDIRAGVPSTLLDHPYHVNQDMDQIATGKKAIIFGDLGKYIVRKVGLPLIGALQDKDFWPGFGIAGWIRFDGQLMDTAAVRHLKLA